MVTRLRALGADLPDWLRGFRPQSLTYRPADYLRGGLGSLLGLLAAAWSAHYFNLGPETVPFIVAPMGASAVLLFAAPASPLAQPWSVVGGNIISSLIGVAAARLIPDTAVAAACAVAVAIVVMCALRCLHPPGVPAPCSPRSLPPALPTRDSFSPCLQSLSIPCSSSLSQS